MTQLQKSKKTILGIVAAYTEGKKLTYDELILLLIDIGNSIDDAMHVYEKDLEA
jgi:hypothetical protein